MGVSDILQICSEQDDVTLKSLSRTRVGPAQRLPWLPELCALAELLASPGRELAFPLASLSAFLSAAADRAPGTPDLLGIPVSLDKRQNDLFKPKPKKTATGPLLLLVPKPPEERCSHFFLG